MWRWIFQYYTSDIRCELDANELSYWLLYLYFSLDLASLYTVKEMMNRNINNRKPMLTQLYQGAGVMLHSGAGGAPATKGSSGQTLSNRINQCHYTQYEHPQRIKLPTSRYCVLSV